MQNWWTDYPWRLIQTNLREIDMLDIRAEQVVKDLQSFRATILMINAAGIIASYPTHMPFHFQSPFLKGDSLLDILDACHSADIRVIARTDFSKVRLPIFQLHPEWAYRTAGGEIVDYNGDVHVCVNSWYQQEGILQILDELFTTHPFDGVFFNMGGYITHDYSGNYHGPCCCQNCQGTFSELFQQEFPFGKDQLIPAHQEVSENVLYGKFKSQTIKDQEAKIHSFLSASFPDLCIANHLDTNHGFIRQESNTALDRPLPLWQYSASENTKWAVGSHLEMVSSNTSVDFIDFPYRHVAVSPHEQSLRLAQNLAAGGGLDYYLIGRLDNHADRSGFDAVGEIFQFHAKHEKDYLGLESQARILLIKPFAHSHTEYRGWYRTLSEGHFFFDVVTQQAATSRSFGHYIAVILHGMSSTESELLEKLDQFVKDGGCLIVSGLPPSSIGHPMDDSFEEQLTYLPCLGIEKVFSIQENLRSPYFLIEDRETFRNLANTDLVFMEGTYIQAVYAEPTKKYMKFIPPHLFGPPERCYYNKIIDLPGMVCNAYGKGKAFYLPWFPASQFYEYGQLNTFRFLLDVIENAANLPRVRGNLPEQVEISLMKNKAGDFLLHLVNLSGHFGNTYHSPVRMTDLEFTIPWQSERPVSGSSLVNGSPVQVQKLGHELTISLSRLNLFDVIKINDNQEKFNES